MKKSISIILLVFVLILTAACGRLDTPKNNETATPDGQINNGEATSGPDENMEETPAVSEEDRVRIVKERADKALELIKAYDMDGLSEMVHPEKGVRFTPYGYVDLKNDLVFTKEEVAKLGTDTKKYVWGSYDGTGDPIGLTFADYYKQFIYDVDFVNAEKTSVNERLGKGNSIDNSAEVYKDAYVVEYHFSGFDTKYEGMDWKSLRLILSEYDGTWYIVGIIHDQWTI